MAAEALKAVEDGRIKVRPDSADRSYRRWMSNIQPWCLSRQLWWGHQIPAYKVIADGEEKGWVVAKSPEEAETKAKQQFPDLEYKLERDADVLDTWFSSGLWPFSTLGWPNTTEDMEKLFPSKLKEIRGIRLVADKYSSICTRDRLGYPVCLQQIAYATHKR
jgi:valyl-tRNA synthetase